MGRSSLAFAQLPGPPVCEIPDTCGANPTGPKCIGQWDPPRDLCFPGLCSPRELCLPEITACTTCTAPGQTLGHDEIGHVVLIPRNDAYKGSVVFWTACGAAAGYVSHVYNPLSNTFDPTHPPFAGAESPFCSGHVWVLDENQNPKLFTVGGSDGFPSGSEKAFWFDRMTLSWSGDPIDLSGDDGNWYPSVISYGNDALQKSVLAVLGGSPTSDVIPFDVQANLLLTDPAFPGCPPQFDRWWTLPWPFRSVFGPPPVSPVWSTHANEASYKSHQYPRALVLSQNFALSAGHAIVICEDTMIDLAATQDWGGNAVQVYDLTTRQHLPPIASLDPNVLALAGGHQDIFGWNWSCAVLQHTLKPGWAAQGWPTSAADALTRYDLDRVMVFGGLPKVLPSLDAGNPREPLDRLAHSAVLELVGAASGPPGTWSWREKARPADPRVLSNAVLLPDGRVLFVGGQKRASSEPINTAELFDPRGPMENGTWKLMKERPLDAEGRFIPRLYHSSALLLPGGEVTLMGGQDLVPVPPLGEWGESMHSVDLFKPPYWHYSQRPSLVNVPEVIRYPTPTSTNTFCVQTNKSDCILRACLMGVGSVTHHFDYGQRYVELMTRKVTCAGGNIQVFPPPKAAMVPPGIYMLFLVDVNRLPSVGTFVKVDY